jgi:adenylate cyclase
MNDKIKKIFTITVIWTSISVFQFLTVLSSLHEYNIDYTDKNPYIPFFASIIAGVVAGLVGGTVLTFIWEKWLRTKPYGWTIRNILFSFTLVFILVSGINNVFFNINQNGLTISDPQLWKNTLSNYVSITLIVPYLNWLIIVLLTLIGFLVNDKYGPGVFKEFLLGKYFRPKKEERTFMFLDLKSSTTIAEKIGEEKYFGLLNDLIKTITPEILNHKGEIYQYVGDEIVISWKKENGFKNANCINCFKSIQHRLKLSNKHFMDSYGLIPVFKAGIHSGFVMTGEIGVVKRDIAFSGDVLNTTSRIQDKCNELGVEILFSESIFSKINQFEDQLVSKEVGEFSFKGKMSTVKLYTAVF